MAIHRLTASAPCLEVTIFANEQAGDYVALIDTGASMTAVHPDIINAMNPQTIGAVDMGQVGKKATLHPTYYFQMIFDHESPRIGVEVVAAVPSSPCQVLIGRDLMSRWIMALDGPGDRLVIAY